MTHHPHNTESLDALDLHGEDIACPGDTYNIWASLDHVPWRLVLAHISLGAITARFPIAAWAAGSAPASPKPGGGQVRNQVRNFCGRRRQRKARVRPPDGLRTPAEAARKLRCSIKTLNAHVAAGDLRYVSIGKGTKRPRRMFSDADLDDFIANQTRKDVACPPTSPKTAARRISTSTSKCEVIGFTARRNARRAAKPKR